MASPKPKPTAIKILERNPCKRPLNLNEPITNCFHQTYYS